MTETLMLALRNIRDACDMEVPHGHIRQLANNALATPPIIAPAIVEGAADVPIAGYAVHSDQSFNRVALYGREDHDEALDAARRWKASVTALAIHPSCPVPSGLASPPAAIGRERD